MNSNINYYYFVIPEAYYHSLEGDYFKNFKVELNKSFRSGANQLKGY